MPFAGLVIITSIMTLIAAIIAFRGKSWRCTMIFGAFSIFTIGPFILGTFFGILGLGIITKVRSEFKKDSPGYGPDLIGRPTTRMPPVPPR